MFDEAGGVTTANDSGGVFFFADEFGGDGAGGRIGGIFGIA